MRTEQTSSGLVIRSALLYDLRLWTMSRGKERAFREKLIELARLAPGESVLDVGCGTGTLALAAKRRVGPAGEVHGIDPSPELIARARRKAKRARLAVAFDNATAQELPFGDATLDVVLSTLVLHQLPHAALPECIAELRRVLKPGGRLLLVDVDPGDSDDPGPTPQGRPRHGHGLDLRKLVPWLEPVGLEVVESGGVAFSPARFPRLQYVLCRCAAD